MSASPGQGVASSGTDFCRLLPQSSSRINHLIDKNIFNVEIELRNIDFILGLLLESTVELEDVFMTNEYG